MSCMGTWLGIAKMRALLTLMGRLVCASALATMPTCSSSRGWVEEECATNATPKNERLFLGRIVPQKYAANYPAPSGCC
jgi:hypothetical protein